MLAADATPYAAADHNVSYYDPDALGRLRSRGLEFIFRLLPTLRSWIDVPHSGDSAA